MARFLCTVWPITGHLNQTAAIAKALQARGHEVAFYSSGAARGLAEREGFTLFPFDHLATYLRRLVDGPAADSAAVDDAAFYDRVQERYNRAEDRTNLARRIKLLQRLFREWFLGTVPHQLADLETIIDRWKPDVVLCEASMHGPILVLNEARTIPVAVFSPFAGCMVPGPDAPPWGLGLPRPRDWRTRTQARVVATAMRVITAEARRLANDIRRRYGLPATDQSLTALSGRMPLYLVGTARELDYDRRDLPPTVHYVGPCNWDRLSGEEPPAWLNELPDDRPVIFVTEGTAHSRDAILLTAAARGLADLPVRVVMVTGAHRDPRDLGLAGLAPNLHAVQYVPFSLLFPRLTAAITHGGSAGVRAALAAGIPQVVMPMEVDQFESAQRVVEAGAGLRLSTRSCTPQAVRRAMQRLLAEPSFRANAERMGAIIKRYGGPARAAELLEGLCASA